LGRRVFGNGNTQATNTDANIVLGRLDTSLVGGKLKLDASFAESPVADTVTNPSGISNAEAAHSVIQIANANMSDAARLISISRGFDPRDFALVAFAGAGALHGVEVARELAFPTVIVPPNPDLTSALDCLLVDIQHDFSESYPAAVAGADTADVEAAFARLEKDALERLAHEGVAPENILLQRTIDMMYQGPWRSLAVSVPSPLKDMDALVESFHQEHLRAYNFRRDETPAGSATEIDNHLNIIIQVEG
jgi:N-methylhydantoinase A